MKTAHRGMTLMELLAATMLAALLMTATLGILRSLAVSQKVLKKEIAVEPWKQHLTEQLQKDVRQSRRMQVESRRLRLRGYTGRDFVSSAATHRPTEIIYEICENNNHFWLTREEIHLDADTLSNRRRDLAAEGIQAIVVRREDGTEINPPLSRKSPSLPRFATPAWLPIPSWLEITLCGSNDSTVVKEKIIRE